MNTYYTIMAVMAVMAVIVFVALFYFKAGYGYLSTKNWGPKIGNKTAWVLMEAPAFLFMLYYTLDFAFSGVETGNSKAVLFIMAGFYLLHYFQRSFIFPLIMRGKSTMPIAIMLMGLVFNTLNAYMIGGWLYGQAPAGMYETDWLQSPQFIIGLIVFFTGMAINLLNKYAVEGPRQQDLDKVRDYMLKKFAENQKENNYWSTLMYNYTLTGFDGSKNYENVLKSITTNDLKKFAKKLIKQGNVIEVSMVGVE